MKGVVEMFKQAYRSLVSAGGRWSFVAGFVCNLVILVVMSLGCRFGRVCGLWYMDGTVFESFGIRLMNWLAAAALVFTAAGLFTVGAGWRGKGVRRTMFRLSDHIRNGVMIAIGALAAYIVYDYRTVIQHPALLDLLLTYVVYAFGLMILCRSPMALQIRDRWDAMVACATGVVLLGVTPYMVVHLILSTTAA